jgi:hypothetical protein
MVVTLLVVEEVLALNKELHLALVALVVEEVEVEIL